MIQIMRYIHMYDYNEYIIYYTKERYVLPKSQVFRQKQKYTTQFLSLNKIIEFKKGTYRQKLVQEETYYKKRM